MRFVLNMAAREIRGSGRRLLVFFFCIAIGVASMVSVRSFTDRLAASTARDARALVAADVRIDTPDLEQAGLRDLLARFTSSPLVIDYTETVETQTMARVLSNEEMRPVLVELRGVLKAFPLHGAVHVTSGGSYSYSMLADQGAVVSPSLLSRLGITIGERVQIGDLSVVIRGTADRIPGNRMNFSPIPRVLVDYDIVRRAGLTTFGSRVDYSWLFRTRENAERTLVRDMDRELRPLKLRLGLSSFRYVENWLNQSFANLEGFTGLVGISMLVLGGIGVASVTRVFIQQKLETVAILKCIGGRNIPVLGAYLAQSLALALTGTALGMLLALVVNVFGTRALAQWSPLALEAGLTWRAPVQGAAIAPLVTMLFAFAGAPRGQAGQTGAAVQARHGAEALRLAAGGRPGAVDRGRHCGRDVAGRLVPTIPTVHRHRRRDSRRPQPRRHPARGFPGANRPRPLADRAVRDRQSLPARQSDEGGALRRWHRHVVPRVGPATTGHVPDGNQPRSGWPSRRHVRHRCSAGSRAASARRPRSR
jgi:putative ABC transport system permease protein